MKFWIITDTHFGHNPQMTEYCGRPKGFEDLILKNLSCIQGSDVLIHLGDVCIRNDEEWNRRLIEDIPFGTRKWLILGNHDKKSKTWYLKCGWDVVCDELRLNVFGKEIIFSHYPIMREGNYLNIHGHFHNSDPSRWEYLTDERNKILMLEHHYKPMDLRKLAGQ